MNRKIVIALLGLLIIISGCNTGTSYQPEEVKAKYQLEKRSYEVGEIIAFKNTSTGYSTVYWDFGDGNTSTEMSPKHIYTKPGDYLPKLTITGNSQTVSYEYKILITGDPVITDPAGAEVAENELTNLVKLTFSDTIVALGSKITFETDTSLEFTWDLGDSNIIVGTGGEVTYSSTGKKLVKIAQKDSDPIIFTQYLYIYNADVSPLTMKVGETISANAYADFEVKWLTKDGRVFNENSVDIPFQNAGNTSIQLLISETDSILESFDITVKDPAPGISSTEVDKLLNSLANAGIDRSEKDNISKKIESLCRYGISTPVTGSLPGDLDQLIIKLRMEATKFVRVDIKTDLKLGSSDKIESINILKYNTRDIN